CVFWPAGWVIAGSQAGTCAPPALIPNFGATLMLRANSIKHAFRFSRRAALSILAGGILILGAPAGFAADEPLRVVASFSILGDMVKEIGGEQISLTTIVGPNADAHSFEPTPKDAKALSEAQ